MLARILHGAAAMFAVADEGDPALLEEYKRIIGGQLVDHPGVFVTRTEIVEWGSPNPTASGGILTRRPTPQANPVLRTCIVGARRDTLLTTSSTRAVVGSEKYRIRDLTA